MMELSLEKKLDMIADTLRDLTRAVTDLRASYSLLLETQKQLVDVVKSGEYYRDFREVLDFVRRIKVQQQPNILHEVERVTPTAIKKSIERKGLDSPSALILGVLNRTVTPVEMVYSLEAIRARQKMRGRLVD